MHPRSSKQPVYFEPQALPIWTQAGLIIQSAHLTFILLDAPNAHAVDDAAVDLGLAVWNTNTIYPVITFEEAAGGLK